MDDKRSAKGTKRDRKLREEGDTTRATGNIIIKTTYDISLDFQDSLLPLGFLSLSRVRSSSLLLHRVPSRRDRASPDSMDGKGKGERKETRKKITIIDNMIPGSWVTVSARSSRRSKEG